MKMDNSVDAFLALLRAGLWEESVQILPFGEIDFEKILNLAQDNSVVGLIAAGLENVSDTKVSKKDILQFVGQTMQIEQRNLAMDFFIGVVVDKLRKADINVLLVKGQGLAQCYERPLWRSCGDVDFFLNKDNYCKAIDFLLPLSSDSKSGGEYSKEYALTIEPWMVELHGTLRTGLSARVDKEIDSVQKDVFYYGHNRSWNNNGTKVFLPAPDDDVFFVFTHFIKHFYKGGMNLRQLCDLCRLLWRFKGKINEELLKKRLTRMGLMKEWKVFAVLAVHYLDMPINSMPLYESNKCWVQKASIILEHIINGPQKGVLNDTFNIAKVFPQNTLRFLPSIIFNVNRMKICERLFKKC